MGLGPSIKMTTLHHFRCPVTRELLKQTDIDFAGIIVDGVSEGYDEKIATAGKTAVIAEKLHADGAIVAIDGWGNHHIDFVNVIEELGKRNIPAIGMSYIGQQGRLVCTNEYVDTIIDFNKNASGYESCIVGDNNLSEYDAVKAVALLKYKIKKQKKYDGKTPYTYETIKMIHKSIQIETVEWGKETFIQNHKLILGSDMEERIRKSFHRIKSLKIKIILPDEHHIFINSNLDFMPIAIKREGNLGVGETFLLKGLTVMLTGVEEKSGYQPANIGSSQGYLDNCVKFDQAGTPNSKDIILHVDVLFKEGEGRTAEGLEEAHLITDLLIDEIRRAMLKMQKENYEEIDSMVWYRRRDCPKIVLVKIVSGLGNMYDTAIFPQRPGGIIGARLMREERNEPVLISGLACLDGAIHSLV